MLIKFYVLLLSFFIVGLVVGCIGASRKDALTHSPVTVEKYDDESLMIIASSLDAFKSSFDRVKKDKAAFMNALQQNKTNPTPENTAAVTEMAGQMFYTIFEFIEGGQISINQAVPELQKYKNYLQRVSASIEGTKKPMLSDRAKQIEKESKNIEGLVADLKKAEKDLNLIKSDFIMLTKVWLYGEQILREPQINQESFSKELEEEIESYRNSVRNYFIVKRKREQSPLMAIHHDNL